ncbi:MAG TPA: heme ABC transporter ATP-binding protein [Gammaproteobacteria bacterium]|jgi:iron complex transport system ATP-binding protein|nr:heme ABC transporter ATP-binding protein [Gammaproteobacteria bacterium]HAJ76225.1 heme ABC transporter ATP-binding protein [Gammaproteobacteria bacterium]|tara:strand:+ start:1542 stop:2315 length:774 start_codon:yes stop_codon:yes gene_type:complete
MILELTNLSAFISSQISLHSIEFAVDAGKTAIIIGPNGAGKTSLLRAICGDLPLSSGQVLFNSKAVDAWAVNERATLLAILPQRSTLEFPFTVEEVVTMGRIPHSTSNQRNREIVGEALDLVDCRHLQKRSFISLSGGEKQRVQLARVAAQIWEPSASGERCLILDEPSASLDLAHQEMIVTMLRHFNEQGVASLVVLHDLNLAAKCGDAIVMLKQGLVAAHGTPEQVLKEDGLNAVFDIRSRVIENPLSNKPMVVT